MRNDNQMLMVMGEFDCGPTAAKEIIRLRRLVEDGYETREGKLACSECQYLTKNKETGLLWGCSNEDSFRGASNDEMNYNYRDGDCTGLYRIFKKGTCADDPPPEWCGFEKNERKRRSDKYHRCERCGGFSSLDSDGMEYCPVDGCGWSERK